MSGSESVSASPEMESGPDQPPRWSGSDCIIALTFVAVSAALRAGELGTSSLWVDDAWVGFAHRAAYSDLFDVSLTAPGYVVGLALWFEAGPSPSSSSGNPLRTSKNDVSSRASPRSWKVLLRGKTARTTRH